MTLKWLWRTAVTGALLLVPVLALIYFLAQIFLIGVKIGRPIVDFLDIERVTGFVLVNLLGLALVVVVCFLAGLAARMPAITRRMQQLDDLLEKRMPGYAIIVGALRGAVDGDVAVEKLNTVLVKTAGGRRLGFEVERMPGGVVVYMPNSPHPQSGITMAFNEADVDVIDLPALRVFEILQFYGKGMGPLAAQASTDTVPPTASVQ